jgi:hypothetical protein
MKQLASAALVFGLLATPAYAGIHFESTTRTDSPQGKQTIAVEGWVEGDGAKVVFASSDNPLFSEGAYLLTNDGGRTVLLVDPEQKSYTAFDPAQMVAAMGTMLKGMGAMVKMSVSNPQVEKLLEEPGGELLGRPTTHYRFRTTYDMEVRVMGMGQKSSNDTLTDTWATTTLADAGFGAYLRREPPRTGIEDLDRLVDAEMGKGIAGVPLKTVSVTVSKDARGRETRTTTTMEVTSLREEAVAPATFQLPAGYERVEMPAGLPLGQ